MKKSGPFLYAGIKEKISNIKIENKDSDIHVKNVKIRRKLIVATTSLRHGVGCSYIGMAVANFLSRTGKENTCFLNRGCGYADGVLDNNIDSIMFPCNIANIFSNYEYIIYDGGVFSEIDMSLLERADVKLMLCWLNDEYISLLADFIKSRKDIDNWVFLFNVVPEKKHDKVYALMEDYNAGCLPVFDASVLDKKVKALFNKLFCEK